MFIPANTNSIVFLSLLPMTCIVIGVSGEVVSSVVSFFNQRRCLERYRVSPISFTLQ